METSTGQLLMAGGSERARSLRLAPGQHSLHYTTFSCRTASRQWDSSRRLTGISTELRTTIDWELQTERCSNLPLQAPGPHCTVLRERTDSIRTRSCKRPTESSMEQHSIRS